MKTKNMPGFTAEAALLPPVATYYKRSTEPTAPGIVIPQARPFGQCYDACRDGGGGRLRCFFKCALFD